MYEKVKNQFQLNLSIRSKLQNVIVIHYFLKKNCKFNIKFFLENSYKKISEKKLYINYLFYCIQ